MTVSAGSGPIRRQLERLLGAIAWFSVFHPRTVLTLTAIFTAIAGYWATGLRLSTDLNDLLPRGLPAAQRLRSLIEHFGGTEPLVLAISGKGEEDIEQRIDLALEIRERLRQDPKFKGAMGLFGEDPFSLLQGPEAEALLLYLKPEEIKKLAGRLSPEGVQQQVNENRARLSSPLGPQLARLIQEDPLGFAGPMLGRLAQLRGKLKLSAREGVLVSGGSRYVLLLVRPNGPAQDISFANKLLDAARAAALDAAASLDLEVTVSVGAPAPGEPPGKIHVGLTGAPANLTDYRSGLVGDLYWVSIISFVANLALYLIAFRRLSSLLVAGVALWVGMTWSLGFTALAVGGINVFTAGSVAILCGLAIDPTIHLYNRYLEEIHAGRDMAKAFIVAHSDTGIGIVAVAATTALAFLALSVSSFRGIQELGIICASGMVLSLIASLVLVPSISALIVRVSRRPDRPRQLSGFGLEPVLRRVLAHPKATVLLWVLIALALAVPIVTLRLDEDFARFRPTGSPSLQLQASIAEETGTVLQPVLALVPGDAGDAIVERSAKLEAAFWKLTQGEHPLVMTVIGPARVIPPLSEQAASLAALRQLRKDGLDPQQLERSLLAVERDAGFAVGEKAQAVAQRVGGMLARDRLLTVSEAQHGALGSVLDEMLIRDTPTTMQGIVSVYLKPGVKTGEIVPLLREAVQESGVPAELVGARVLSQDLKPHALKSGLIATLLATLGVWVVLISTFRRLSLALLTLLPLLMGVFVSVGLVAALNVNFNLISLSMLPLLIGMGIDNGIHVVHRFRDADPSSLEDVIHHTGRGLVMTAITTVAGFAALFFADNPGLQASALLVCLGITAALLSSVTLLPALLVLTRRESR